MLTYGVLEKTLKQYCSVKHSKTDFSRLILLSGLSEDQQNIVDDLSQQQLTAIREGKTGISDNIKDIYKTADLNKVKAYLFDRLFPFITNEKKLITELKKTIARDGRLSNNKRKKFKKSNAEFSDFIAELLVFCVTRESKKVTKQHNGVFDWLIRGEKLSDMKEAFQKKNIVIIVLFLFSVIGIVSSIVGLCPPAENHDLPTPMPPPPRDPDVLHPDNSIKEYNKGLEYYDQGKYTKAIERFKIALENAEPFSLDAAKVHISLGLARYMSTQTSDLKDAYQVLSDALDDMVSASAIFRIKGEESDVMYGLLNQGYVNEALGETDSDIKDEAAKQYKEAYKLAKKLYGETDYYTCDICNRIASLYMSAEKVEDAEFWIEKALKISVEEDQASSLSILSILNSIGSTCWQLGRFDDLGTMLEKAKYLSTMVDVTDKELASLYNNLGAYYKDIVEDSKTARFYDELASLTSVAANGTYSFQTAASYHNLANDFKASDYKDKDEFIYNCTEALRLYRKSLEILEQIDQKTIKDNHVDPDGFREHIREDILGIECKLNNIEMAMLVHESGLTPLIGFNEENGDYLMGFLLD